MAQVTFYGKIYVKDRYGIWRTEKGKFVSRDKQKRLERILKRREDNKTYRRQQYVVRVLIGRRRTGRGKSDYVTLTGEVRVMKIVNTNKSYEEQLRDIAYDYVDTCFSKSLDDITAENFENEEISKNERKGFWVNRTVRIICRKYSDTTLEWEHRHIINGCLGGVCFEA